MVGRLSDPELQRALERLPGWRPSETGAAIERSWRMPDFRAAFALVERIGRLAVEADHHPEISFGFHRVSVTLFTHDAQGVSDRDIALAARINDVADAASA